jgi:hypothetical protein
MHENGHIGSNRKASDGLKLLSPIFWFDASCEEPLGDDAETGLSTSAVQAR